jgi:hypothetical protein
MVVKFRTPNGGVMHGRPYTKAEEADFYRRAGSIVGIYRGARTAPTSPAPQQPPKAPAPQQPRVKTRLA